MSLKSPRSRAGQRRVDLAGTLRDVGQTFLSAKQGWQECQPHGACWAMLAALIVCVGVSPALAADPPSPNRAGIVKSQFIYEKAPFPECHASTIVESNGGVASAWFGGTEEGNRDVGIWLSRYVDDRWTAPVEVANGIDAQNAADKQTKRYPCWNPVLFQPREGPLMLAYKVGPSPSTWWGMLITSDGGGKTWSQPRRLPEGILGPIKNKPVQLASGEILAGSSSEHKGWRVHFERTSDGGKTWQATAPVNDGKTIGAIQPSILLHGQDRLQAIGRSQQRRIFEIWSNDAGRTWGEMSLTTLPNPNSGIDAVTLADGRHVLVYNHTLRGRSPLNVAVSKDGKQWQTAVVLEDQPGEYSYPAVIQSSDGLVHVTYTWKRQRVRHVVLDPSKFELRPLENGNWPRQL
ncbi:MAG: sialidase family protein [Pirellulales bacterium]